MSDTDRARLARGAASAFFVVPPDFTIVATMA
jgi:hypothetical protein